MFEYYLVFSLKTKVFKLYDYIVSQDSDYIIFSEDLGCWEQRKPNSFVGVLHVLFACLLWF